MNSEKLILLDADVIIHFTKADKLGLLNLVYPGRLLVLTDVIDELSYHHQSSVAISNLIKFGQIKHYDPPESLRHKIMQEYSRMRKEYYSGVGETMCMAVARFDSKIIASSNWRDIQKYCKEHSIEKISTVDILYAALQMELIEECDFDYFIYNVTSQNSKLFYTSLEHYRKHNGLS